MTFIVGTCGLPCLPAADAMSPIKPHNFRHSQGGAGPHAGRRGCRADREEEGVGHGRCAGTLQAVWSRVCQDCRPREAQAPENLMILEPPGVRPGIGTAFPGLCVFVTPGCAMWIAANENQVLQSPGRGFMQQGIWASGEAPCCDPSRGLCPPGTAPRALTLQAPAGSRGRSGCAPPPLGARPTSPCRGRSSTASPALPRTAASAPPATTPLG